MRNRIRVVIGTLASICAVCTTDAQQRPKPAAGASPSASSRAKKPGAARPPLVPTPAQLDAVGRTLWERDRDDYGVIGSARWEPALDTIMQRLADATAVPGLKLRYELLDTPDVNAAAYPGGYVSINRGLLEFVDSLTAGIPNPETRAATANAYLAAVLGHELAHVTLGHVNEIAIEVLTREQAAGGKNIAGAIPDPRRLRAAVDAVEQQKLAALRHSRDQESAADRVGALYLVRAGWQIQSAINLMHALDALERGAPGQRPDIRQLSWLQDHPRAAGREAALESFRGELKSHQVQLDDALTLIANDAEPALAISLLDSVLAVFPDLSAARHARAAALQQQYFALMPVQTLRMRASTPSFGSRYLLGIRGADDAVSDRADALLKQSRAGYTALLRTESQPFTMSNLAVLDAYAGDLPHAMELAARADSLAPSDADVVNNHGVVQYLAGDRAGARATFERLLRTWADSAPSRVLFNYGRVLTELHDAEGGPVLWEYLANDETSGWSRVAMLLRQRADSTAAPFDTTRRDSSSAPLVDGVALGDNPAAVMSAVGAPESRQGSGTDSLWSYPDRGLVVAFDSAGVRLIALETPGAGTLQGVAVGDPLTTARAHWGVPTDDTGTAVIFEHATWILSARRGAGLVSEIGVGRVP
jgi:predicted Zn-dependent protease